MHDGEAEEKGLARDEPDGLNCEGALCAVLRSLEFIPKAMESY